MGRKGVLSSAGASFALVAASLALVAVVSTLIAVRGFPGVRDAPEPGSVVLSPSSTERGANGPRTPEAVVLGGRTRRSTHSRRASSRPRRDGLAARRGSARIVRPASRSPRPAGRPARPNPASPIAPVVPESATKPPAPLPATPLDPVVDSVTGTLDEAAPSEKVGEALLDLRDVLP